MTDSATIRAPRYEVDLTVVCESEHGVFSGKAVDVSESGLFLETPELLPHGTTVTLVPNIEKGVELPAEIKAEVVRVDELQLDDVLAKTQGLAFRFKGLMLQDFAQLREYLRKFGTRKFD